MVVAPQALLKSVDAGVFLRWSNGSAPIAPGSQLSGFEVVSNLKPGLTTAYVSGKEEPLRTPPGITEAVVNK